MTIALWPVLVGSAAAHAGNPSGVLESTRPVDSMACRVSGPESTPDVASMASGEYLRQAVVKDRAGPWRCPSTRTTK